MDCNRISRLLSAFLDEELGPEERQLVRRHVFTCSQCQHTLAQLKQMHMMFSMLDSFPPPVDFAAEVKKRTVHPVVHVIPNRKNVTRTLWALTASAAMVSFIFLGGVIRTNQARDLSQKRPETNLEIVLPLPEHRYFPTSTPVSTWRVSPAVRSQTLFDVQTVNSNWLFPPQQ